MTITIAEVVVKTAMDESDGIAVSGNSGVPVGETNVAVNWATVCRDTVLRGHITNRGFITSVSILRSSMVVLMVSVYHDWSVHYMRHGAGLPPTQAGPTVKGFSGGGEDGVRTLMATVSDLDGQVGSLHLEATVASCVVLGLHVAIVVHVAEGTANIAIGVTGLVTGGRARVVSEGIAAITVLGVVMRKGWLIGSLDWKVASVN